MDKAAELHKLPLDPRRVIRIEHKMKVHQPCHLMKLVAHRIRCLNLRSPRLRGDVWPHLANRLRGGNECHELVPTHFTIEEPDGRSEIYFRHTLELFRCRVQL